MFKIPAHSAVEIALPIGADVTAKLYDERRTEGLRDIVVRAPCF